MNIRTVSLACAALFLFTSTTVFADNADWPQWRGPNRDGKAAPQKLLQKWPAGGPSLTWSYRNAGAGYSAVSVSDGRIYTMGARNGSCFAFCLDAKSGEQIWEAKISRAGTGDDYNDGWGAGPRSTPTVDGNQVFVISDIGTVAALDKTSGDVQWSVDLVGDFGGSIPKWGYSESALVDGKRVIVTPGGSNFMVGLDRLTGKQIWGSKQASAEAQYVSVMKGNVGSSSFYVTASKPGLLAFDANTGEKLFSNESTGNDVAVIPTPILDGNRLYHTSDYGAGCVLLNLSKAGRGIIAKEIYHLTGKTMMNHHGGVIFLDGVIYGNTKSDGGPWMAQDLNSGETLWQEKIGRNKSGSIAFADGRLYCYNDKDGSVILVEPNRNGWKPHGELKLPQQTEIPRNKGAIWAHPVIANQILIIRDQDLIFAYDISR